MLPARVQMRQLDENTVAEACRTPERWRAIPAQLIKTRQGALTLTLPPYAVTRLDYTK